MSAPEPTAGEWLRRLRAGELSAVELAQRQLALLHEVDCAPQRRRRGRRRAACCATRPRPTAGAPRATTGRCSACRSRSRTRSRSPGCRASRARWRARATSRTRTRRSSSASSARAPSCSRRRPCPSTCGRTRPSRWRTGGRSTRSIPRARRAARAAARRALIGGGGSLLGIGTDGGGSIRVPSHYNGIAGLRPSARLVPETGCWPSSRETGMLDMAAVGPMARSVADLALTLARDRGRRRDRSVRRPRAGRSTTAASRSPGLRVGFYADDGAWPATAETRAAVERAAALLGDCRRARRGGRAAARRRRGRPVLRDDGRRRRRPRARRPRRRERAPRAADDLAAREPRAARALGRRVLRAARALERVPRAHAALHRGLRRRALARRAGPGAAARLPPGRRPAGRDATCRGPTRMAHSVAGVPVAVVPVGERARPAARRAHREPRTFCDHVALAAAAAVEEATGGYAAVVHGPCYRINDPPLMSNVEPVT